MGDRRSATRAVLARVAGLAGVALVAIATCDAGRAAHTAPPGPIRVAVDLTTRDARSEESNLADVVADGVRNADHSDAALIQAAALADADVARGSAGDEAFLKALEYRDDDVVVVKLSGAQLRRALEHGLALYPQRNAAFLQVSGITASIDGSADHDHRVTALRVGGSPAGDAQVYTVAMPSPLANGALGYFKVWDKKAIDHSTGKTVAQALTSYLNSVHEVGAKGEARLAIK